MSQRSEIQETTTGSILPGASELLQDGLKHHLAGRLVEAETSCRRILAAQPEHADALHLLGLIADQSGQHDLALDLIGQAIRHNGQNAAYFSDLGVVLIQQGKFDAASAACRQALAINPDLAVAHSNLGRVLKDLGKFDEAVAACQHAVTIKPDIEVFHSNLGAALREQGKLDEAVAAYRRAVHINPARADGYCKLGNALRGQGKFEEAVAACRQAIAINPRSAEAHSILGAALFDQGKLDEGLTACRQAIILNPNSADAHDNLGTKLMQLGHLLEARAAFERAVRLAPRNTKYRRSLGNVKRFAAGDPHLAAMEQLAGVGASLSVGERIELHFALGKAYEDVGRHAEAFRQWRDGNALKRRQVAYNEAAVLGELDRARSEFSAELIRTWQNMGNPSSVPVFIIGMPRSGTTLIEQILASHPRVFGGGELAHFRTAVQVVRTTRCGGSASLLEPLPGVTGEGYPELGTRYLAETERLAPGATHITDKMPANYMFAGLIHLALPNATIIHAIRDPVDTCLSCFSKLFTGAQNHTYDLVELGRYYRHYRALMEHWDRVLPPGRILDVRYEDVVADLEGQARRIIAHCRLDWEPSCLAFHQTGRAIRTASAAQVRQPIYNSAIGRWRVYEPFLGPMLTELGVAASSNGKQAPRVGHDVA